VDLLDRVDGELATVIDRRYSAWLGGFGGGDGELATVIDRRYSGWGGGFGGGDVVDVLDGADGPGGLMDWGSVTPGWFPGTAAGLFARLGRLGFAFGLGKAGVYFFEHLRRGLDRGFLLGRVFGEFFNVAA